MKKFALLFILSILIISCKNESYNLSDLKSNFYSLKDNPLFMGDKLEIKFDAHADKIDSVELDLNGKKLMNNEVLTFENSTLGMNKLQVKVYMGENIAWGEVQLPVLNPEKETPVEFNVIKEWPHPTELFTQGFFYHNNQLYESGGQYNKSKMVAYKLGSTQYILENKQDPKTFAEGATLHKGKIYQLTYRQRDLFVFDPNTLELLETLRMPAELREGWGITSNGQELLMTDGSQNIYFYDDNLNFVRKIQVTGNASIYTYINELEYIDGKIYANVWTTNYILVINPNTGAVEQYFDLNSISEQKGSDDVLNGIAQVGKNILVTGKNWAKIYELERK